MTYPNWIADLVIALTLAFNAGVTWANLQQLRRSDRWLRRNVLRILVRLGVEPNGTDEADE